MSPCIPHKPTPECERCRRHWPATAIERRRRRVIAIDASVLPRVEGVCVLLVQRGLT